MELCAETGTAFSLAATLPQEREPSAEKPRPALVSRIRAGPWLRSIVQRTEPLLDRRQWNPLTFRIDDDDLDFVGQRR